MAAGFTIGGASPALRNLNHPGSEWRAMPCYIRPRIPGATIFFTVVLARRGSDLLTRHIDVLRHAVNRVRTKRPFRIDAWVVLPDHLHAVWTLPPGDSDYSLRWAEIKGRFSMDLRRAGRAPPVTQTHPNGAPNPVLRKGQAGIWQQRFHEHHIRDQTDLAMHIRYCLLNPVKHGLVQHPADWPHSSIHRDIRRGRVEPEWCGTEMGGAFGE